MYANRPIVHGIVLRGRPIFYPLRSRQAIFFKYSGSTDKQTLSTR